MYARLFIFYYMSIYILLNTGHLLYKNKKGKITALKIGDSTSDSKTFKYEGK